MSMNWKRRGLLKGAGAMFGAGLIPYGESSFPSERRYTVYPSQQMIHLSLNENPYGPSPNVGEAIRAEFARLYRYVDKQAAQQLAEQIAHYEQVPVEQVILGNILDALGLYLGAEGGPGGEFIYSSPGYLALIDAAARVGGVGVPVPLNSRYQNDLPALLAKVNGKTRAMYLINPHLPTGTLSGDAEFKRFLVEAAQHTLPIVDEAYLEYTVDFTSRSAVSLVRRGANVMVFRTFDKIHGLAGLPMGYVLAPVPIAEALRHQGIGDAMSLERLNVAAASAALRDPGQVEKTRKAVDRERAAWFSVLQELKLEYTEAAGNFVFFHTGMPHANFAAAMLAQGVDIGRAFQPYNEWARITIGLPQENRQAQAAVRNVLETV
jgi:histidinol-phosphate aminotransferase